MKIIGDFHIHTIASGDAFGTIKEIVQVAKRKRLKCIAITDHGPKMPASSHYYFFESLIDNVSKDSEMLIYPGVEANIINLDGSLDLPETILQRLEFIHASFHTFSWNVHDRDRNTQALLSSLLKYNVKCIAHPNYPYYEIDFQKIIPILLDKHIAIEINNKALKKDKNWSRFRNVIKTCQEQGVKFLINSDAHNPDDTGNFGLSIEFANYCGLEEEDILNTEWAKLKDYFNFKN
ncbi:putative phosphatase YcdX [Peptococcaceae bacterium CEB3]|nr:putative phosphatase YcdX [Peptococcaceae bacterium CEB3]